MLSVDFNAVSWEGVKFRGRACQRRDSLSVIKENAPCQVLLRISPGHLAVFAR
jgi:hypothetical protein